MCCVMDAAAGEGITASHTRVNAPGKHLFTQGLPQDPGIRPSHPCHFPTRRVEGPRRVVLHARSAQTRPAERLLVKGESLEVKGEAVGPSWHRSRPCRGVAPLRDPKEP